MPKILTTDVKLGAALYRLGQAIEARTKKERERAARKPGGRYHRTQEQIERQRTLDARRYPDK